MGKPKLGDKHICSNCEARFFDLGKNPAVCPKCDTEVVIEKTKKKKSQKAKAEEEAAAAAALAAEEEASKAVKNDEDEDEDGLDDIDVDIDDDDDDEEDDSENSMIEDTSDILGGDEDGISEVLEHVESPDKTD